MMVKLGILLTEEHRMLSVAAIIDVFDTVNQFYTTVGESAIFDINLVSGDENPPDYSGYKPKSVQVSEGYDLLLIPAFRNNLVHSGIHQNMAFIPWLAHQYSCGASLASFCTGAFLLAATGLLNQRPATTHINAQYPFISLFPDVKLEADAVLTEKDNLYTSGGATNTFHLLMRLVELYCGRPIAIKTAKLFSIDLDRKKQGYFGTFQPLEGHGDSMVSMAQEKIKTNFHHGTTIEELIQFIPASRRNLVRRFKQATGITPIEYLQKTRIEAAKNLLEHSRLTILEVMLDSGYNDLKSFRTLFKKNVGMTPTSYRDKFGA